MSMSTKKTLSSALLATAVGVTAASAAFAATPTPVVEAKSFTVNGLEAEIGTFVQNGKTLASIRDLGEALGADISFASSTVTVKLNGHTVMFKSNSDSMTVDGKAEKLAAPVKNVKYKNYVELNAYIKALGGTVSAETDIEAYGDLLQNADDVQWAGAGWLIASQETETGRVDYLVDAAIGKYEKLLDNAEASALVLSPNGKKAAYTDNQGAVYILDLTTKTSTKASADTSIKPELVWSADGSALYYLQGDKGTVISRLDLATSTVTPVYDDKIDYKSALHVSSDGKFVTYLLTTPPKVTAPSDKPVENDDVTIDASASDVQAYQLDTSVKDAKPVKLTSGTDDKLYFSAAADGSGAYYVSVPSDSSMNSQLVWVGKDQAVKTLIADMDVMQAQVVGGKLYVLTAGSEGKNGIWSVDPTNGSKQQLYAVSDFTTQISVSADGSVAIVANDKTYVYQNGHWKPVTR